MNTENSNTSFLSGIKSPEDLRLLRKEELPLLAEEIRRRIINVVLKNGGHLASNLGVVELTLALHRVFESPKDMIFWDVGHQCYTHKIITGRNDSFDTVRQKDGLSGFPKRSESIHDILETGHAATSISAGIGAVTGRRAMGDRGKVIVVVGDGALTGGMAYEGLNHAGHLGKDLIIVYNDNNMSISKNVGGISNNSNLSKLSTYVSRLTTTRFYQHIRAKLDRGLQGIPIMGYKLFELLVRLKRTLKALILKETIFSEFGFEYVGPIDGHSISRLTDVLGVVRNLEKPVVVHVVTQKGRGYELAENNPSQYHGVSPMLHNDGKVERKPSLSFTDSFSQAIVDVAETDPAIVAVSAAMEGGTGLKYFKEHYPGRFYDVGIAEQHAVTFSAGLALAGLRPVTAIYSTFMQRAVDQVIHDIALPGLPVVFAMDRAGLVPADGETHQGVFDIPLFRSIPGISLLAPASEKEMHSMLRWAVQQSGPVMLRYPKAACPEDTDQLEKPLEAGRGVMVNDESGEILLISVGGLYQEAREALNILAREGIAADHYNLRFIKPLDNEYLLHLISEYPRVYMVEDGALSGGIGEQVAGMVAHSGIDTRFEWAGVPDIFFPQASRSELLEMCGLDRNTIALNIRRLASGPFGIVNPKGKTVISG